MTKFDAIARLLRERLPGLELLTDEPMSRHTTFRVGGPAALMALPRTEEELVEAVAIAREMDVKPLFVGNGSNLLVDDGGLEAFVIKTGGISACRVEGTTVTAGCGASLAFVASEAAKHGLTGLEFAHGIPGTLGGAVCMNAGAYGGEMVQVITSVRALDEEGRVRELPAEECAFRYRHSLFSDSSWLVLSAAMELPPGDEGEIRAKMSELMEKRREKQPLDYPSAGSTFKRPEGCFAAALIDGCGLKGTSVGGAQVSPKHAGFVVNTGGATCRDVLELMRLVRDRVYEETDVTLEPEVKYLK